MLNFCWIFACTDDSLFLDWTKISVKGYNKACEYLNLAHE